MSDNPYMSNMGEQMKDALSDALKTGDFRELNNLVSQTVTTALNEVGRHVTTGNGTSRSAGGYASSGSQSAGADIPTWQQRAQERARKKQLEIQHDWQERIRRRQEQMQADGPAWQNSAPQPNAQAWQDPSLQENAQPDQALRWSSPNLPSVKMRRVGKVSNVLYQVFGGIGLGITALVTLIRLFVFLAGDTTLAGWIINFAFLAFFYGMIHLGVEQKKRLKRAVRYVQLCGHKMYGDIENLARSMGKNVRFVVKDLRKMLNLGIFPEGHLDEQKTCLMLNDTIYRQYLETEENRRLRERESRAVLPEAGSAQTVQEQPAPEVSEEEASELDTMVAEGMECIRRLRDLNDRIPGEVISAKLFRLESLLKDIFDSVKEHPDQMHRMHKLMSYYLPTTLKLVEAYEDFDRVSSPGEEIIKAKAEIENTLDTINQAFTELLNNLFQDAVFDATTDAQVLKTMLAKEGLMREMELVPNRRK